MYLEAAAVRLTPNERLAISLAINFSVVGKNFDSVGWIWITAVTWCLPEGESSSPQPTARIAKAITSRILIFEMKNVLEDLGYFIFVCDDAELNRREILQSELDFITKTAWLNFSCVLVACFVSHRFTAPHKQHPRIRKGEE